MGKVESLVGVEWVVGIGAGFAQGVIELNKNFAKVCSLSHNLSSVF